MNAKKLARWLIPASAIPVLVLLAYGFRVSPRSSVSLDISKGAE